MGRPKFEVDAKVLKQIEQLAGYGLTLPQIAAVIGCSEKTLRRRRSDEEAVLTALAAGKAKAEAIVGKALFEKAKDGDVSAIRWWETTRAGRREGISNEHVGPDGGPIVTRAEAKVVIVKIPDNGRDSD